MRQRKYYDEADLVNAAGLIKVFCSQHVCDICPFAIVHQWGEHEKKYSCKLRHIPAEWDLGGNTNGDSSKET